MNFSPESANRYSRHFVLKEIGVSGQKKLLSSKVLVIGAGALGSAAITYLAAAGVGTIGISDCDIVELSNLQRQVIYKCSDLGKDKTEAAMFAVKALNPDVSVITFGAVTVDNIEDMISKFDFVLDCTDRFETKFLISDACVLAGKPFCHAGVVRFTGQAMTFVPGSPCLRCLLGEVPTNAQMCSELGVLGAVTGILGSVQATEAIKFLLGAGKLLTGRVLTVDGLNMEIKVIAYGGKNDECPVCNGTIKSVKCNRDDYKAKECKWE